MSTVARRPLFLFACLLVVAVGVFAAQRANAASSTPVVYVATGSNFPDALGAASAAAVQGGPVLLVQQNSIPQVTKDELTRLAPDLIVVAGGTAVVSDAVVTELGGYASSVARAAGSDRYTTAVEVSKSAFPAAGGGSAALEARVALLESKVADLEALLVGVSRSGDVLLFEGMNLQVVNGDGLTASMNGLGNVIIGYNEDDVDTEVRTGSHYLIVGADNDWTSYGGIVAGYGNTATALYASVTGGAFNTASNSYSSVTGGSTNTASGLAASVCGGQGNTADGSFASVTGGQSNTATGSYSSVTGGTGNQVVGSYDTIVGGDDKVNISWDGAIAIGEGFWDPSD